MSRRQFSVLFLLVMVVAVWGVAGEKGAKPSAPQSVVIVLEGIHSREGISETKAISVINAKTISKLEAFFPNYRSYPTSDITGGWERGYSVYFNFAQGRSICVIVSENGDGATWSVSGGDFATRGEFGAFVRELQKGAGR